jgi:uncharacterized protein
MVDGLFALVATTPAHALDDVGRSLLEAFFMFWETLWPLVLGFGLSGAVQAFVTPADMGRALGNHRPAAVARASGFGLVSSSCSYAASAMAKSLFQKGADFVSALVFMFASTNLVVELGIVLAVLIGWQFTAAEFVGGPIMVFLLAVLGGLVLRPALAAAARSRLASGAAPGGHEHVHVGGAHGSAAHDSAAHDSAAHDSAAHDIGSHDDGGHDSGGHDSGGHGAESGADAGATARRRQLRSRAAWSEAAGYTMADLNMLRREMVIGYLAAGFLAVLVPNTWWTALFARGHGTWTSLENAVVGPVIAFLSCVCSVGNVPLAAALWKGGISFGGVVSFIFADLLAAPLVLVYRRYYGGALALRLVGLFWVVMAAAGLIVGVLFSAIGLVPEHRPVQIVTTSFSWGYTTVLNIIFLAVFGVLYWLHHTREGGAGGGSGFAADPVCGMRVPVSAAPAHRTVGDETYWFCSEGCAEKFEAGGRGSNRPSTRSRSRRY